MSAVMNITGGLAIEEQRLADARRSVTEMEDLIRTGVPVEMPVTNHFAHGVYGRELFIPKGTVLTGKIHKYSQLNIMSKGDISVLTEGGVKRVQAPFTIVSPAGTKRIAYAHEDTIWTTVHGTEETDIEKIEKRFIAQSEDEFLAFCEQQRLCDVAKLGSKS